MTGSKYRELRKQDNADKKMMDQLKKYETLKKFMMRNFYDFHSTDNLFFLVEMMRFGNKILIKEGFPLNEFKKYGK